MGRELFETESTFRHALQRCDEILRSELDHSLLSVLYPTAGEQQSLLDETAYTQPALFALEYALCELWRSWGVVPDVVLGHSVGEYAAACAANVFSLEQGLTLIAARGRLMQSLPKNGSMVAVLGSEEIVVDALSSHSASASIAAINGPDNFVISGASDAIDAVTARLEAAQLRVAPLTVSHAFHSPLMDPILSEFEAIAEQVDYSEPEVDIVSNLSGRVAGPEVATASYWRDHIRNPVRFAAGMAEIEASRPDVLIEIGPRPVLLGMGRACVGPELAASDVDSRWLASISPPQSERDVMLGSLAHVYAHGTKIDWSAVQQDQPGRTVHLPSYPWQHESFWLDEPTASRRRSVVGTTEGLGNLFDIQWRQSSGDSDRAASELPTPSAIANVVRRSAKFGGWDDSAERKSFLVSELEILSLEYAADAVSQLGMQFTRGERISTDQLVKSGRVVEDRRRLLDRLLSYLRQAGVLNFDDGKWEVLQSGLDKPAQRYSRLVESFPDCRTELSLLGRCGRELADVLQGGSALQLIFPDGSTADAERLYQDSPFSRDANQTMQDAVRVAVESMSDQSVIRVLEIGAGTGGTTAHLLAEFPEGRTRYHFTDVSAAFTERARNRFAGHSELLYGQLDISNDPLQQGYKQGQFDIVIGASVLHATPDLRATIRHAKKLLAPGGLLMLVEGTHPTRWVDMIFGLLDGWWLFSDKELRAEHPLVSAETWHTLLSDEGFSDPISIANADSPKHALFPQAVIVAQQPVFAPLAQPGVESANVSSQVDERWLIFSDKVGVGAALAARLSGDGGSCTLVNRGERYETQPDGSITIDPTRKDHYDRLLSSPPASKANRIVHLWSLDIGEDVAPADVVRAENLGCRSCLYLIQGLAASDHAAQRHHVWLVTRNAQTLGTADSTVAPLQTGVWGLASVLQQEQPELCVRLVDLQGEDVAGDALFAELGIESDETMVTLRHGNRYLPRLAAIDDAASMSAELKLEELSTCLITGGYGAFGLIVAEWLVNSGVRRLALVGRRTASDDARGRIEALRNKGAEIHELQGDVADAADVVRLDNEIQQLLAPLRAVFHCAGVVDSQLLFQQEWADFRSVVSPKLAGAWNLHHLTASQDLDHFVLFSSIASFMGQAGQGSYSVGNAFLNGLARYRRSIGLPAISVNWGVIQDVGLVSAGNVQQGADSYEALGIGGLTSDAALGALQMLIRQNIPEVSVLRPDEDVLAEDIERPSILSELAETCRSRARTGVGRHSVRSDTGRRSDLLVELSAVESDWQRKTLLEQHVCATVAKILRTDADRVAADTPLQELGLDSLMGVELRNQLMRTLKLRLSATLTWRYPTIELIADYLSLQLQPVAEPAIEIRSSEAAEPVYVADTDINELSDDEAAARLAEALDALEGEG